VASLLKKNPKLFKDNKPVKIKISSKDETGKSITQVILSALYYQELVFASNMFIISMCSIT
jgi:hypothetical protein